MAANPARLNDIALGVCPCHPIPVPYVATWAMCEATVLASGLPRANLVSTAVSSCGHTVVALTASATVHIGPAGSHRINDLGTNCGMCTTVMGEPSIMTGD